MFELNEPMVKTMLLAVVLATAIHLGFWFARVLVGGKYKSSRKEWPWLAVIIIGTPIINAFTTLPAYLLAGGRELDFLSWFIIVFAAIFMGTLAFIRTKDETCNAAGRLFHFLSIGSNTGINVCLAITTDSITPSLIFTALTLTCNRMIKTAKKALSQPNAEPSKAN